MGAFLFYETRFPILGSLCFGFESEKGFVRVFQKHGDRHRPHPSGNRTYVGNSGDSFEIRISTEFSINAVDPHVDDHGSRVYHIGGQKVRHSRGGHDDIGILRMRFQVSGF